MPVISGFRLDRVVRVVAGYFATGVRPWRRGLRIEEALRDLHAERIAVLQWM